MSLSPEAVYVYSLWVVLKERQAQHLSLEWWTYTTFRSQFAGDTCLCSFADRIVFYCPVLNRHLTTGACPAGRTDEPSTGCCSAEALNSMQWCGGWGAAYRHIRLPFPSFLFTQQGRLAVRDWLVPVFFFSGGWDWEPLSSVRREASL